MGPIPRAGRDLRIVRCEMLPPGGAHQRALKTGGVPGGKQLLWVGAGTARPTHLGRNRQVHIQPTIGRARVSASTANCGGLSSVQHSNRSRD